MEFSGQLFSVAERHAVAEPIAPPQQSTIFVGAPLSGKTTLLRSLVAGLEQQGIEPSEIAVLTPTRSQAARLRDLIALDSDRASERPRAQSIAGYAFALVESDGMGLLSGAAQEQLIRQLVDEHRGLWGSWGFDHNVPALQGFVQELRDLFAVLAENTLQHSDLIRLQAEYPPLRLAAAMTLYPAYQNKLRELSLLDPSELALVASAKVKSKPVALLIDDAHNLSLGQLRLVRALAADQNTYLFGDPDAAVLGFRNSTAHAFIEFGRSLGFAETVLPAGESQPEPVRHLMAKLASRIPTGLITAHRPRTSGPADDLAKIYESQSLEADHLAASLRRLRLTEQISWDEMSIVARTRNQLEQIAVDMAARGVPCRISGASLPLREQAMARALLDFTMLSLQPEAFGEIESFLTSPLVGLTSIEYRSLQREVRQLSAGGALDSLRELMGRESSFEAPARLRPLMKRLAKVRELDEPKAHAVVSIGFELAERKLAELAKGVGPSGLAANRSLDSALELFAAAQRWDQRELGSALDFAKIQLEVGIPEDSLAPIGLSPAVRLQTPSAICGPSRVVAIPRLQEGIWPNLNPRNSLLGASSLQSFLVGRLEDPTKPDRSELADELRFFYRSISSASEHLLLSAMQDASEQPSQLFQILGLNPQFESKPVRFDLRQLVGRLRREVRAGNQEAAAKLAAFAIAGVPGAEPASWHGLMDPEVQALPGVDFLAASKLQEFEKCPLHWFIRNFGGDAGGFSASLGTLMHAALEHSSDGVEPQVYVSENWHSLEFESSWQQLQERRRAAQMTVLLTEYINNAAELVASEEAFSVQIGGLEVRGKIDRIEKTDAGYQVVDLKTGRSAPSQADVAGNRQLAVYQLAVSQSRGESAGARIVSIGSGKLREIDQPPLTPQSKQELQDLVGEIANQLGQGVFVAQAQEHCSADSSCQLLLTPGVTGG